MHVRGGSRAAPRAPVHQDELKLLHAACGFDWRQVRPSIFGSLLQDCLGRDKQWALGAHYTHEADIQKVVEPTIVRPWRERIENLQTHAEAVAARGDLMSYVVLDPACGSGNFLYVAYRELRRLEVRLREREEELRAAAGLSGHPELSYFPLANIKGIEIEAFAVSLARVTLWMGHKLAVDELEVSEATLPLTDLSGIRQDDALKVAWPRADAIIGNPPFHGSQMMRRQFGDAYVEWLREAFGCGVKDYCVYWFRKAQDQLAPDGRAGLVRTNSISQNRARGESLDYVVANGGVITDAVSSQDWPGEAAVDVSIVNWIKQPTSLPPSAMLDREEVARITPSLRQRAGPESAAALAANSGRSFQGPIPAGDGFVLDRDEAERVLARGEASYEEVVRPYLTGEDIADDPAQGPRRYVIDFGMLSLEEASQYPAAIKIVRDRVKPRRDRNRDRGFRTHWWRFGRPRPAMRTAIRDQHRFIAANAQGKRIHFTWQDPATCPSCSHSRTTTS